jgi:hypothetical protein
MDTKKRQEVVKRIDEIFGAEVTIEMVQNFLAELKNAVRNNNAEKFAQLISYPLHCYNSGKLVIISNKEEFVKSYASLINNDIKNLILSSNIDNIFINYKGIMLGRGEIWFDPSIGIFTINANMA